MISKDLSRMTGFQLEAARTLCFRDGGISLAGVSTTPAQLRSLLHGLMERATHEPVGPAESPARHFDINPNGSSYGPSFFITAAPATLLVDFDQNKKDRICVDVRNRGDWGDLRATVTYDKAYNGDDEIYFSLHAELKVGALLGGLGSLLGATTVPEVIGQLATLLFALNLNVNIQLKKVGPDSQPVKLMILEAKGPQFDVARVPASLKSCLNYLAGGLAVSLE